MPVFVSMLRGINVGGHGKIKMDELRTLYIELKLEQPQSYIQSGNVVFRTKEANEPLIASKLQKAIEKKFGLAPLVVLRSTREMGDIVRLNPFKNRQDVAPNKLHVFFLATKPAAEIRQKIEQIAPAREEIHVVERQLYIYFPDGAGQSKLVPTLDRVLKNEATARNWNSVLKLLEMAESLEK